MPRVLYILLFLLSLSLTIQANGQHNLVSLFDLEQGLGTSFFQEGMPKDTYDRDWRKNNTLGISENEELIWWKQPLFLGFALNASFVLIYAFYYFSVKQIRMEERLKAEFDKKLSNVEMTALRSQMNPHFIFNCLNSIDYYILKNECEKASDYLNRFSRLIRLILQNSRSNYVNLKDEIEALILYIEMESLRFHNRFEYHIQIEEGLNIMDLEIPPMLFQPYVENAIWHGLLHKKEQGLLLLKLGMKDRQLHCIIEDNGVGRKAAGDFRSKSATKQKSMGMRITEDRISLINRLYDTSASVEIIDLYDHNGTPNGTQVNLSIPI